MAETPTAEMTESLSKRQQRRLLAVRLSRDVLVSTRSVFAGNTLDVGNLLQLAEYILHGEENEE